MLDVGIWELLLIGIVALVVVGPERLPEVARTVGRWVAKAQRFVAGVKSDINAELESGDLHKILGAQKEQIQELKSMVDSTRRDFESSTRDAVSSAKEKFKDIETRARVSADQSADQSGSAADKSSTDSAPAVSASTPASTPASDKSSGESESSPDNTDTSSPDKGVEQ